jgi:cell division protein FtsQ
MTRRRLASAAAQDQAEDTAPAAVRAGRRLEPWRLAFFGVLVLAVLAGLAWVVLGSNLLVVRHVEVSGNRLVSAGQVRDAAAIRPDQPLATVNTAAIAGRVEQLAPVLSARVSKSWPDTIVILVRVRTPAIAVPTPAGFALIDQYGVTVTLAPRKPAGMPVLASPPAVLRGNPAVFAAVLVLRRLPAQLRRQVRSVSASQADAVTLDLDNGITVVWGSPAQSAQKAAELLLLLRTHARYFDVSDPTTAVTQG